jgi:hypothetical protein
MKRFLRIPLLCAALMAAPQLWAGQNCASTPLSVREIERGMALAQATSQALEASGAQVVILARAGQDLSRYGQTWSHLGYAYREVTDAGPRPVWRVVHKLNTCGTAEAQLYRQGLGEFFLDRPARYEAAFVVPTPAVQALLQPLLRGPAPTLARWHTPRYSMLAYPWGSPYQQCNQWLLETLAGLEGEGGGAYPTEAPISLRLSRSRAQVWLRQQGYSPAVLHVDALTRLSARIGAPHISFDDQPFTERIQDRITTLTADSVLAWLQRSQQASPPQWVRLPAPAQKAMPLHASAFTVPQARPLGWPAS